VVLSDSVEVSEMLTCSECGNKVVVTAVSGEGAVLGEAPKVEEDWGE
jgi:lysine biosynthesis protein LysW